MAKRLRALLSDVVSPGEATCVCNSYDVVGDIAIIRVPESSRKYSGKIAEAVMAVHRNVRTVLAQTGGVGGEFRLRRLEHVAGEVKTFALHRESGCLFGVDVGRCYFSPRLFHERMRVAGLAGAGEVVVNMFAGVGCFSVLIAKKAGVERVFSIDVNPVAVECMRENVRMNGVFGRVVPILGDAGEVVERRLCRVADRVLMPLPERALEYLPYALLALKGGGGWVHYYDFVHAGRGEDPVEKVKLKVSERLRSLGAVFEVAFGRVVRGTGPYWYQVVLDIKAKKGRMLSD